jgi:peroxiredoxin
MLVMGFLFMGLGFAAVDLFSTVNVQPVKGSPPAPVFVLPTLEGRALNSGSLRGKVVLVNFWATWCGPCKEEMPGLERLQRRFQGEAFELLAVTTDQQEEAIRRFAQQLELTFPILIDEGQDVSSAFGVRGLPTTILIDKQGHVTGRAVGPRAWDSPAAVTLLKSLLETP